MLTIKNLKPYQVTSDEKYIYVTLAYRYFDIMMNQQTFKFIPIEATTIQLSRYTRQVINLESRLAFQRENRIIYVKIVELIILPTFMYGLNKMADDFIEKQANKNQNNHLKNTDLIFYELERENIKRLIDRALDAKDEGNFNKLVKQLKEQTIHH